MDLSETQKTETMMAHTLPTLEKIQKSSFKIIIPEEVERKIRHLCNKVSTVEWSGTLFFDYSGNWEEGSLTIICKDIFVMDIGSAGYTEFDVNPDVVSYMCEHSELLDCQMGLVHSHQQMSTFFSSTDTATLREEGNKRNHFVSLIVNNAGTYTAGITRKVVNSKVSEVFKYGTFNGAIVESNREYEAVDTIEWCNLEVIKEGINYSFKDVDDRLEEIKKSKEKVISVPSITPKIEQYRTISDTKNYFKDSRESQLTLFDVDYMDSEPPFNVQIDSKPSIRKLPNKLIQSLLLQLITGSVAIADESRIIPSRWAASMEKIFDKRFDKDIKLYEAWAEQFCEFLVYYPSAQYKDMDETEYANLTAMSLIDELSKLPKNKYIETLKECLELWIV